MSQSQPLIAATQDAVGSPGRTLDTENYHAVILAAGVLTAAEEVDIFIQVGAETVVVSDRDGNAVKLTATDPCVELAGGPIYVVLKDATTEDCGVFWTPVPKTT